VAAAALGGKASITANFTSSMATAWAGAAKTDRQ
jgi:hypothetical protein